MRRFKLLILFTFLMFGLNVLGQKKEPLFDYLNIEGELSYGKAKEAKLGISLTRNMDASIFQDIFYQGPFAQIGYSRYKENLFSSRIGYEFIGFYLLFGGRISLSHYSNFTHHQFYINPEIGLTMLGGLNLTYRYAINLNSKDHFSLQGHYIVLSGQLKIKRKKRSPNKPYPMEQ